MLSCFSNKQQNPTIMTYAKPSTPFVLTILFLFAITAIDSFVLSKSNPGTVVVSTKFTPQADSTETVLVLPQPLLSSNIQTIAP